MRRSLVSASSATLLGLGWLMVYASPGSSQTFAPSIDLYSGASSVSEGVRLGGWGSGMAVEDRAYKTAGDYSIRVETDGYYSGARIQYSQPKDLTNQKADPHGFVEFIIRFQPGTLRQRLQQMRNQGDPGGFGSGSGGEGSMGAGGAGGSGFPSGGFSPGSFGGEGGAAGGPGGEFGGVGGGFGEFGGVGGGFGGVGGGFGGVGGQAITPDTRKLKVSLHCVEGTFVATNFPVVLFPAREEGWFTVAVPFVAFKGLDAVPTARVREIRVFGDTKDTFWIGEIRTTADDEPIQVDSLDELEVSVGEAIEFAASATGGISPLHYSWDFDYSDGLQEDASGPVVYHIFRRPSPDIQGRPGEVQPFVVTLTVRDLSGAKKPVRRQTSITVNK